jgi:hypothetical protein
MARSLGCLGCIKPLGQPNIGPVRMRMVVSSVICCICSWTGSSHPAPFELSIRVRISRHKELIRSVEVERPWEESDAKELTQLDS